MQTILNRILINHSQHLSKIDKMKNSQIFHRWKVCLQIVHVWSYYCVFIYFVFLSLSSQSIEILSSYHCVLWEKWYDRFFHSRKKNATWVEENSYAIISFIKIQTNYSHSFFFFSSSSFYSLPMKLSHF